MKARLAVFHLGTVIKRNFIDFLLRQDFIDFDSISISDILKKQLQ